MNQLQTIIGTFFITDDEYKSVIDQLVSGSDFISVPRLEKYFNKSVIQSIGIPEFIRSKIATVQEVRITNDAVYAKEDNVWKVYKNNIWMNTLEDVEKLEANVYSRKKKEEVK